MKLITEQEQKLMDVLDMIQHEFNNLPYHLSPPHGDERGEFQKRINEAKYIITIRAMLRDGGHTANQSALPEREKFTIGPSGVIY